MEDLEEEEGEEERESKEAITQIWFLCPTIRWQQSPIPGEAGLGVFLRGLKKNTVTNAQFQG